MPASANTLLNRFTVRAKFRHMQILIKLAELGSMRRAAQAVNMTQPAISQQVSELEKLLETELFFRHARGVEPTEATKELLPIAQRILSALEEGAEAVASRLQEQGGVVRIAASPAALGGMIHGRLDQFAQKRPDIQVHISQIGNDPLSAITSDSADIVCARRPSIIPEGWQFTQCLEDKLVVCCGKTHALAQISEPSIEQLSTCKWLMNRVGSISRSRFEEISEAHDWPHSSRCQIIMHIPDLTREMLLTGEYLAIMPQSVALPWLASGQIKQMKTVVDAHLAPLGYLCRRSGIGQATTAFANHLSAQANTVTEVVQTA